MARSLRARLSASGGDKSMLELMSAGARYEGLRAAWFGQLGRWDQASDCLSRQALFETEAEELWKEGN